MTRKIRVISDYRLLQLARDGDPRVEPVQDHRHVAVESDVVDQRRRPAHAEHLRLRFSTDPVTLTARYFHLSM